LSGKQNRRADKITANHGRRVVVKQGERRDKIRTLKL
jgi:hypothetical protein